MNPMNYVYLSAMLFSIGAAGVLLRRNAIVVFMCVELMLNATNLAFVTFARMQGNLDGQVIAFFVMVVAAAEVVVGLAIIVAMFRTRRSASVDDASLDIQQLAPQFPAATYSPVVYGGVGRWYRVLVGAYADQEHVLLAELARPIQQIFIGARLRERGLRREDGEHVQALGLEAVHQPVVAHVDDAEQIPLHASSGRHLTRLATPLHRWILSSQVFAFWWVSSSGDVMATTSRNFGRASSGLASLSAYAMR